MPTPPEHFFRFAFSLESSFKTASTWVNPRGVRRGSTAITPGREVIPIENTLNSFGDRYGGIPGAQTLECAVDLYLHAAWVTDLTDIFKAAMGVRVTTASATFVSSADNFTVSVSGNATSGIVKMVGSDSKTYFLPSDVDAGSGSRDVTLGIGLPSGVTATSIVNPGSAGGALYKYGVIGEAAETFSIETDWSGKPSTTTQQNVLASGCAVNSFTLLVDRAGAMTLQTKWIGASYTEDGGAGANTADTAAWTAEGPAWASDCLLTKAASPTIADTKTAWKTLAVELAAPLVIGRGGQGLDGGSTASSVLPGSDITGYTRDAAWEGLLSIRVPYDASYYADFLAQTAFRLYICWYPGVPQGAAISTTKRTVLYFKRLVPVGEPQVVTDAGGRYHDLTFQVERDRTTNSNQERVALARFNS